MSKTGIAKIFMRGRSQVVCLPAAFRLAGNRVRVSRVKNGVLLEPMVTDIDRWFAELDRFADVPFMEGGRHQPRMPDGWAGHHTSTSLGGRSIARGSFRRCAGDS
jgi:antitoxin VapB